MYYGQYYPQQHGNQPVYVWNPYANGYMNGWSGYGEPCYRSSKQMDYGPKPFVVNMEEAAKQNTAFRTALWTGKHLQVTLMSLHAGEDIGVESHPHTDQFLGIEEGHGVVQMGESKDKLSFQQNVHEGYAIVVPAGTWHNLTNVGDKPLKLFSIYAPPQHPYGTVHETKAIAEAAER